MIRAKNEDQDHMERLTRMSCPTGGSEGGMKAVELTLGQGCADRWPYRSE